MGAEGYLTLGRIGDGLHLLDLDKDPVFLVTEPVCVLPACFRRFGDWANLYLMGSPELQDSLEFSGDCRCISLGGFSDPQIGVCIVRQGYVQRFDGGDLWKRWEDNDQIPGAIPWDTLLKAWGKIRSGYWYVKSYYACGANGFYDFQLPLGCEETERVEWMFWT